MVNHPLDLSAFETFARERALWFTDKTPIQDVHQWMEIVEATLKRYPPDADEVPYNPYDGELAISILTQAIDALRNQEYWDYSTGTGAAFKKGLGTIREVIGLVPLSLGADAVSLAMALIIRTLATAVHVKGFDPYPQDMYGFYETLFAATLTTWLLSLPGAQIEGNDFEWYVTFPESAE